MPKEFNKTIKISLIEPQASSLRFAKTGEQLGTDRPKATTIALAWLDAIIKKELMEFGYKPEIIIRDLKLEAPEMQQFVEGFNYFGLELEEWEIGKPAESVLENEMDIACIRSQFTASAEQALKIIDAVKKRSNKTKIIVGGMDASFRPEVYLKRGAHAVVLGLADGMIGRLIHALHMDSNIKDIPNLAYASNGNAYYTRKAFSSIDMDSLPLPSLGKLPINELTDTSAGPLIGGKPPFGILVTSLGCDRSCVLICETPGLTKLIGGYKAMSPKRALEWAGHYKKFGIETITIEEDQVLGRLPIPELFKQDGKKYREKYNAGRKALMEMFNGLRNLGFRWAFLNGIEFGRFYGPESNSIDEELLETLMGYDGKVGCINAYIPMEIVPENEKARALYQKLKPFKIQKKILEEIVSNGILSIDIGVVVGGPNDDKEFYNETIERLMELKKELLAANPNIKIYFSIYNHAPFPGTTAVRAFKPYFDQNIFLRRPSLLSLYASVLNGKYFNPAQKIMMRREMSELLNEKASMKAREHYLLAP